MGDIILATKTTFYNFGINTLDGKFIRLSAYKPNSNDYGKGEFHDPLFYKSDDRLLSMAVKASKSVILNPIKYKENVYKPRVLKGIITSTDNFNQNESKIKLECDTTGCIAFEMEGAAVAQICYNQKIPFLMIKSISDDGDINVYKAIKGATEINAAKLTIQTIKLL